MRLRVESLTRQLAEDVRKGCPPGFGFMLWLVEGGRGGCFSYVASCRREDAILMAEEWLAGEGKSLAEMNYHLRRRVEDLEETIERLRAEIGT